jgi:ATP-dependent RNA helicase DeaD
MNFDSLKIKPELLKAINDARYSEMTEIQQQVIPEILNNNDILGQAPTGTGKTCAFVLPSLERIDNQNKLPQVLVLSPTRELALQTIEEYKKLSKYLQNINSIAIYGGQDIKKQLNNLKRNLPQIIVATPGRLLDHIKRRSINLNNISTVVLDEADEMLNMGFIKDITSILSFIKNKHQTILLSATMPKEIIEISKRFQQPNPYKCKVQLNEKDLPEIKQYYIRVNE